MTEWLIHKFIKNPDDIHRTDVRFSYSLLSGIVGIICNILLFVVKLITGILSGSAAILSDAVNNLTDCLSCILSLIGNRIAARPADSEHPFGHGRMEYVVSLCAAGLIFSAAYELFLHGIREIMHPSGLKFTPVMGIVLLCTIAVKYWMSRFNMKLGIRLDHSGMKTAAADSRNDVIATSMTLVSTLLSGVLPNVPLDGIMGALVAVYIFYGGIGMTREIINKLLGDEADEDLKKQIESILLKNPEVLGVHDVVIHDYGAGNRMGTAHAEVDAKMSLRKAHEIIDVCEEEAEKQLHVRLTIHADPIDTDEMTASAKRRTEEVLSEIAPGTTVHDFHVLEESGRTVYRFDAALPFDTKEDGDHIRRSLEEKLSADGAPVHCIITFDRGYSSERSG